MVGLTQLLVPILVSAVIVFIVSSILHMLLPYHRSDYGRIPKEEGLLDYIRGLNLPSGDYFAPAPPEGSTGNPMKDPVFMERAKRGPRVVMTVGPGFTGMGAQLTQWFVYALIVSFFGAYLASRFLQTGTDYLTVFRLVGTATFMGYGLALPQYSIWYGRKWSTTLKSIFDALIYGCLTAGVFGWLWPR
jgi:hypothetical protein